MRAIARLRLSAAVALAAALVVAPAHADEAAWGDEIAVMADAEMDDLRGGFNVNGIEIQFGVLITTLLEGVPVLQTRYTIDASGALIEQTMSDLGYSFENLTQEQRAQLGLEGVNGAHGLVLEDDTGITALIHNVSADALQNIVVNTASDRDINQEFAVTLVLPGFEAVQADYNLAHFGMSIDRDFAGVRFGN
jgi:hypothetical protein